QPMRDGFVFNPAIQTTRVDPTNVDFALVSGFISGRVLDHNTGMAGVTISAGAGLTTTTSTDGTYRLAKLPPGSKTISPTKVGYSFGPGQIPNVQLGTTNADFNVVAYPIAGRITDPYSNGVAGVSVAASTATIPAISGDDGNYLISSVLPGPGVL